MSTEKRSVAPMPPVKPVVSACDSCKRRKLKCSGEQPCKRCHASTIVCTYGRSAARAGTVDYIRHLESRVAELEAQLTSSAVSSNDGFVGYSNRNSENQSGDELSGTHFAIDTFIRPDHNLLLSVNGSETYYGRFASLNILRIVRDKCDNLANIMAPLSSGRILAEAFVKDNVPSPIEQEKPLPAGLPELAESRRLSYVAIEEALPCHECIDRDTFFTRLEKVFAKPVGDLDSGDRVFLGLVFALMGFAKRYEAGNHSTTEGHFCQVTAPPGSGFYHSSMEMLQLADLCSLDMVRAIIYQVLFLAANDMLSKAHTRLSIGVATALRIGLHVPNPPPGPGLETSPERVFRRRQVFSLLYAIDTYLASTLGMPKLIHHVDTCQILPLRDEDMHDRGISFVRKGPYTPEAETLVACQILVILAEIHARRDPFSKSLMLNSDSGTYELMSHEVYSLDRQLNMWYNSLPPVDRIPPIKRALHAQLVIRLTYAITQMSLHRPFLHHLIRRADDCNFRMDGYAQGSHCITAAMQSVWLLQRLDSQGFLHESIWFYISSLAFAASSLVYFVLGSPYSTTVQDAKDAALKAHGLLAKLGRENEAAQQCFVSIDRLLAQANLKVYGHSWRESSS